MDDNQILRYLASLLKYQGQLPLGLFDQKWRRPAKQKFGPSSSYIIYWASLHNGFAVVFDITVWAADVAYSFTSKCRVSSSH
jgi:hypothetical protein